MHQGRGEVAIREFGPAPSAGAVEHCQHPQLCLAPVAGWQGQPRGQPVGFGMLFQWERGLAEVRNNAELAEMPAESPVGLYRTSQLGDRASGWGREQSTKG